MNRVGLVLLLVASCGDSPALIGNGWPPPRDGSVPPFAMAPEAVRSGTRLRARWEVAHGARRLIGWHDSQLGIDCGFEAAYGAEEYVAGRKHRCIPPVLDQAGYFADPSCTRSLALGSSPATTRYVMIPPVDSCTADPALFEVGSPIDPTSTFENSNGVCVAAQQPPAPLYEIGAAVPTSTFAAASEQPDAVGQLWLVADDGARAPWRGWDGTRAVEPTKTNDGKVRWAPWRVAWTMNRFADSACTVPVATKETYRAPCTSDAVVLFGPEDACTHASTFTFSALGPSLNAAYVMQDTGCTAQQPAPYFSLSYAIGAPIPNERFQEVGEMRIGDGTVQVRYATMSGRAIRQTQGGGLPQPDEFVDVASGLACIPLLARDGKTRCLPTPSMDPRSFFLDAACTEPIMPYVPSSCGGTSASVPPVVTIGTGDGTFQGRPVTDPVTVTQLYSEDFYPCMPDSGPVGVRYYRLGPELPPDRFAEVTIEVD